MISRLSIQISKHTKIYKTQSIQDSMNRPNIEFITFIYKQDILSAFKVELGWISGYF